MNHRVFWGIDISDVFSVWLFLHRKTLMDLKDYSTDDKKYLDEFRLAAGVDYKTKEEKNKIFEPVSTEAIQWLSSKFGITLIPHKEDYATFYFLALGQVIDFSKPVTTLSPPTEEEKERLKSMFLIPSESFETELKIYCVSSDQSDDSDE